MKERPQAHRRTRPLVELILMVAVVEISLWLPYDPGYEALRWLLGAAITIVGVSSYLRRRKNDDTAEGPVVGRRRAWTEAALATLIVASAVIVWLVVVREPYDEPDLAFLGSGPVLLAWTARRLAMAAFQQIFLQLFFWRVLWEILGSRPAATVATAALFGAFHLPSPALALATGLGAVVWICLYRRSRRLLPLILSHAVLAGLASAMAPERLFYEMQTGARATASLPTYRLLAEDETRSLLRDLTSPEYFAHRGGSDPGYVEGLYGDVLGRPALAAEVREQTARLRETSRGAVAKALVASGELGDAGGSTRWKSLDYRQMKPGVVIEPEDDAAFEDWYDAEGEWRWARTTAPAIRFRLDREPERPYLLELYCGAFAPQTVDIELNGQPIGNVTFTSPHPEAWRLVVASGRLAADGGNELRFRTSGDRPASGEDPRALGLGFRALRLEPLRFPSASVAFPDDDYFLAGFSVAEKSLRWSQEPVARIAYPLRRVEPGKRYALRLTAGALGRQGVEVALNGQPIARWTLEGMTPQVRTAEFEAALLHPGANKVELRLPDARSPEGDTRLLGVALVSVRLYVTD